MLEYECCFFGKTTETTFEDCGCSANNSRIKMTKWELATLFLDPMACVDPDALHSDW